MNMKILIVFTISLALVIMAHARISTSPAVAAGNIADGMYTVVGEASHRCLEIPSNSCAAVTPLQIFDCDKTGVSNNQKFNVVSDEKYLAARSASRASRR